MNRTLTNICFAIGLTCLISCQKEIDGTIFPVTPDGNGDSTATGSTSGELLVHAMQINSGGADTTLLDLTWDAGKKLVSYRSTGRSNGFPIDMGYVITRLANGNIQTVKEVSNFAAGIDSVVYMVNYQPTGNKLSYVKTINYTMFGNLEDSTVFTYNAANLIAKKEVYSDLLGLGAEKTAEDIYTYDANANLIKMESTAIAPDPSLNQVSTANYVYTAHKAVQKMGEEAYFLSILDLALVSPNHYSSKTIASASRTIVGSFANEKFNALDRPYESDVTVTGVAGVGKAFYYFK